MPYFVRTLRAILVTACHEAPAACSALGAIGGCRVLVIVAVVCIG